jgi:hypothetical protein
MNQNLLIDEVVIDIKKYKENRDTRRQLELSDDDFHLGLAEQDYRYNRKDTIANSKSYEITPDESEFTAIELIEKLNKIRAKHGNNVKLSCMNIERYNQCNILGFCAESVRPETDKEYATRIRKSMAQRYSYATGHEDRKAKKQKEWDANKASFLEEAKKFGLELANT